MLDIEKIDWERVANEMEKRKAEEKERLKYVAELLRKNPLCERCPQWNPYYGCTMCKED